MLLQQWQPKRYELGEAKHQLLYYYSLSKSTFQVSLMHADIRSIFGICVSTVSHNLKQSASSYGIVRLHLWHTFEFCITETFSKMQILNFCSVLHLHLFANPSTHPVTIMIYYIKCLKMILILWNISSPELVLILLIKLKSIAMVQQLIHVFMPTSPS